MHRRALTLQEKELRKQIAQELPTEYYYRPRVRAECESGIRPCPFVGCRYNLYLDANSGVPSLKYNFPDMEPWDMPAEKSCVLDIASSGAHTLEEIAPLLNITRERVRQVEGNAIRKIGKFKVLRD